jgi:integrase
VPLTVEEVQALADAIPERYRAVIITQAGLGLRVAELLALRISDIDFLRHKVKIEYQLTQNGLDRVPPKTPRSRRTLPLPQVVADALAAHLAEFPPAEDGSVFTTARQPVPTGALPSADLPSRRPCCWLARWHHDS